MGSVGLQENFTNEYGQKFKREQYLISVSLLKPF